MKDKAEFSGIFKSNLLCRTLAGSPCPLVTITDKIDTYLDYYDEIMLSKKLPNLVRK